MTVLDEIIAIGVPLAKAAWGMISEAITASKERREEIRARLVAAKAALLPASEEAHRVHDEELARTKATLFGDSQAGGVMVTDSGPVDLVDLVKHATEPTKDGT